MKLLNLLYILLVAACSTRNNQTGKTTVAPTSKTSVMDENKIELTVNQEKTIQLRSRGAAGLRIIFTLSDSSVVSVTRKELQPSDIKSLNIRAGDAVPAIFSIKGLKSGTATIHFAERKPGKDDGADIPLKDFQVRVEG